MSQIEKELNGAGCGADAAIQALIQVKTIVAFASAKGGTGKSTMVANFAAALALKGRKIGMVDADLDAPSAAAMLGLPRMRADFHAVGGVRTG